MKRVCRALLLAVSVNACLWPHTQWPESSGMYPCRCIGYPRCTGCTPNMPASMRCGHRRCSSPSRCWSPEPGIRPALCQRPQSRQGTTAVSRANNFLFYTPGLLPAFTASRSPRCPSHSRPPIPFLLVSPPPLPPARTLSSQLQFDPSAIEAGRRSASPLLITPQVSISTTAPTRRLPGRRSQICPQPSARPRLERGFPRCTRIL